MGAFLRAFWGKSCKYDQSLANWIMQNGGQRIAPQNILAPLPDLNFNVDYDFAIKHDSIQ